MHATTRYPNAIVSTTVHEGNKPSADPDCAYSIAVGVILGIVVGALFGFAMLVYCDSAMLNRWSGVSSLIISSSFGWALFGMIVGSGGIFSSLGTRILKRGATT
jgi:formate/nitrite transporter FocA (FNT family)